MHAQTASNEFTADSEGSSRYLSSHELAQGVEVQELNLHDVSNNHLQELLQMVRGWRQRGNMASG